MTVTVRVTPHALARLKERYNPHMTPVLALELARKALVHGKDPRQLHQTAELKAKLDRYAPHVELRFYNNRLWIFEGVNLMTVLPSKSFERKAIAVAQNKARKSYSVVRRKEIAELNRRLARP